MGLLYVLDKPKLVYNDSSKVNSQCEWWILLRAYILNFFKKKLGSENLIIVILKLNRDIRRTNVRWF